jgi:hypothetical protein
MLNNLSDAYASAQGSLLPAGVAARLESLQEFLSGSRTCPSGDRR